MKGLIRDPDLGNVWSSLMEEETPEGECVCEESKGVPIGSLELPAAKGLQSRS